MRRMRLSEMIRTEHLLESYVNHITEGELSLIGLTDLQPVVFPT